MYCDSVGFFVAHVLIRLYHCINRCVALESHLWEEIERARIDFVVLETIDGSLLVLVIFTKLILAAATG